MLFISYFRTFIPDKAFKLLNEIYRILKPGCWLRIVLPDLKRTVTFIMAKLKFQNTHLEQRLLVIILKIGDIIQHGMKNY
jgi:predicted SAM-dependent methyltransferase